MTNQTTPTRLLFPTPDHFDVAGRAMTQKQLNDMNFDGTSNGDFAAENNTIVESYSGFTTAIDQLSSSGAALSEA